MFRARSQIRCVICCCVAFHVKHLCVCYSHRKKDRMYVPSTRIAKLIQSMLTDGVEHDGIVRAVEAAELTPSRQRRGTDESRGARLPSDWHIPNTFVEHAS